MARFETFDRDIRVATEGLSQDAISRRLAGYARSELGRLIKSGQATSSFDRFVNGVEGRPEAAVQAPGPILYVFSWWPQIIAASITALQKRSPRGSGAFAGSFIVISGGRPVQQWDQISPNAEVVITNFQPYVRKIEVGAMQMSVPPAPFAAASRSLKRKYRDYSFRVRFLDIASGVHPRIPYILKRNGRRRNARAGAQLTYPALIINLKQ